MDISLSTIKKPLQAELKQYEDVFSSIMSSNIPLVDLIAKYIVKHKGKGLRPLLVLLSGKLVGTINRQTYMVASVIELLHTASLIHDDVVDEAQTRRSFPSINAVWKNKVAVLMGDYLLSKCLITATETGKLDVMNILANSSKRLSRGELLQIEKSRRLNITEDEYYKIISDKTAALIGAASYLGAMTTSEHESDWNNLKEYGENLGMAFQIKDDLLDYYGHQNIIGKPVGNDILDKKITLPLLYAFNVAGKTEEKKIKKLLKNKVNNNHKKIIIDFIFQHNGISLAEKKCRDFINSAQNALKDYKDSEIKKSLFDLSEYVISRTK